MNGCEYFAIARGTMGSEVKVIGKNMMQERIEEEDQGCCLYLPGVTCGLIYSHISLLSTN